MIYTDTLQTAIMLVGSFILTGFGKWGCGRLRRQGGRQRSREENRVQSPCLPSPGEWYSPDWPFLRVSGGHLPWPWVSEWGPADNTCVPSCPLSGPAAPSAGLRRCGFLSTEKRGKKRTRLNVRQTNYIEMLYLKSQIKSCLHFDIKFLFLYELLIGRDTFLVYVLIGQNLKNRAFYVGSSAP